MQITIIGAGRVGRALGAGWARVGHEVRYAVTDPAAAKHADLAHVDTVEVALAAARVASANGVVVLAVPFGAVREIVSAHDLSGLLVIDATNPLAAGPVDPQVPSGAEQIAGWAPEAVVVKAFNTTGSANMLDARLPGGPALMLVAGDDAAGKAQVLALAEALGFDAVDAGGLSAAGDLEHLARIWIRLAYSLGHGPGIAFGLMRR